MKAHMKPRKSHSSLPKLEPNRVRVLVVLVVVVGPVVVICPFRDRGRSWFLELRLRDCALFSCEPVEANHIFLQRLIVSIFHRGSRGS